MKKYYIRNNEGQYLHIAGSMITGFLVNYVEGCGSATVYRSQTCAESMTMMFGGYVTTAGQQQ